MADDKILERVKKLLALSSSSNEHEAGAALAKAQALMEEHNLTEGKLRLSEITHANVKSQASVSKMKQHELALMNLVARAFGCKVLWMKSHSNSFDNWARFTLAGPKSQIPIAEYTAQVLMRKLASARSEFVSSLPYGLDRVVKTKEADGFCLGWVAGVARTVHAFSGAAEYSEAIEEYLKTKIQVSDKTAEAQDREIGAMGYYAGKSRGEQESLNRPMEEGERKLKIGETKKLTKE